MHMEAMGCAVKLNTEVALDGAKVISLESLVKVVFELRDEVNATSCDKDIVYID